jgi:hypothetical protein
VNGPGASAGGGGIASTRTIAPKNSRSHTLSSIPRHTSITSRPPGRVALARLANAIAMSVKNIVPVRLAITSKD